MLAEFAGKKTFQLLQRERLGAGAQFDKCFRRLAPVIVDDADHDHLLHGGVFVDRLLDHLRIDVEAAGDDHVLLAVDQIEIAVAIHVADIAGQEAIARERLCRLLRPVPIAFGDVRSLDADFADLARRQHLVRIVKRDHVDFDAGQHQANRARFFRSLRRMGGAGRAGLGHAPAAPELHVGLALENPGDLYRQRRAARSAMHQRGQIAAFQIGEARDRDPHRGNAGKSGRPLDLDVAHHRFNVEALVQRDQVAALQTTQQDHRQREDVKQRQYADDALDDVALRLG